MRKIPSLMRPGTAKACSATGEDTGRLPIQAQTAVSAADDPMRGTPRIFIRCVRINLQFVLTISPARSPVNR